MQDLTRRGFAGLSLGAFSAVAVPHGVLAAAHCIAAPMPNILLTNCASRRNFRLFRQYSSYIGLAGVVSVKSAPGAQGVYGAGNLFLFPWLKPAGQKARNVSLTGFVPKANAMSTATAVRPIPNALLPQDEYLCRYILRAPWQNFIGFMVDTPFASGPAALPEWRTNTPKLADGAGVEISWASSNLNGAWFAGAHAIPNNETCKGSVWRALITKAVGEVSANAC